MFYEMSDPDPICSEGKNRIFVKDVNNIVDCANIFSFQKMLMKICLIVFYAFFSPVESYNKQAI